MQTISRKHLKVIRPVAYIERNNVDHFHKVFIRTLSTKNPSFMTNMISLFLIVLNDE